jgi:serine phosphatase RsbU (regulator of sigma subunit)
MMLKSGDTILFYTDGGVEAVNRNEELYGFDRLLASTEASRHMGAEDQLDFLLRDISGFVGGMEQHDDITMVAVKVEHTRKEGGGHEE